MPCACAHWWLCVCMCACVRVCVRVCVCTRHRNLNTTLGALKHVAVPTEADILPVPDQAVVVAAQTDLCVKIRHKAAICRVTLPKVSFNDGVLALTAPCTLVSIGLDLKFSFRHTTSSPDVAFYLYDLWLLEYRASLLRKVLAAVGRVSFTTLYHLCTSIRHNLLLVVYVMVT